MTLKATNITHRAELKETGTDTGLGLPRRNHVFSEPIVLATGTGSNQSDLVWSDERTLSTASEELDLAGSLTDIDGTAITFVDVTTLLIRVTNPATGKYLLIGGAASNAWETWVAAAGDKVKVEREFSLAGTVDGYAVTAGTGDKLKIEAVGSVTYQIAITGRSA